MTPVIHFATQLREWLKENQSDLEDFPEEFRLAEIRLPSSLRTLRQTQIVFGSGKNLSTPALILSSCSQDLEFLADLMNKMLSQPDDSRLKAAGDALELLTRFEHLRKAQGVVHWYMVKVLRIPITPMVRSKIIP